MPGVGVTAANITLSFAGVDVLKDVSVSLQPGEIHAIVGENGAGKSSLAKVIAGEYRPRLGTLSLNGVAVQFRNPREALRSGIALIHQEPITFPDLDIAENIYAGHLPLAGPFVSWREAHERTNEILRRLGLGLDSRARVQGLSVAQQQMVELAAGLSHDAKVWIFDETTAPLTPKEVEELFVVMRQLRAEGCTVAMVTHHLDEVLAMADRITVLRDGAKVAEKVPKDTNAQDLIQLMIGRRLLDSTRPSHTVEGAPALRIENLSAPGFNNVSFEIRAGEIVGLAGLVGSGRTELARALFGITRATTGTVYVHGQEVVIKNPRWARKKHIALVPEDRQHDGLLMPQDITFNATLAQLTGLSRKGWLSRRALKKTAHQFSEKLRVARRNLEQPVSELSGGNQQKVVLSKWLMTIPKLLILDEPTRGIDVGAKQEVHELIREQARQGIAVLMISSDLMDILALSDRIVVMRQGATVAAFEGKGATEEQIMSAAFGQGAGVA